MTNPYMDMHSPYFEGTTIGNSYYITIEQDGTQLKMAVSAEAIQQAPEFVLKTLIEKLNKEKIHKKIYYHHAYAGSSAQELKDEIFGYTKPVKADAMRLDKPAEIGPGTDGRD